ncbi:YgiQ family radical SAM protein [Methanoregula sp.]|uniref:YgiQ family radical SAM protein n=1 Tax=Methanoregula sp. TaxID=2052170 RepID=UPI00236B0A4B|nr:YgiQ family radical SAM protein [Methanoregula sp.]MDD1686824.1 YgiQ family radical SAM protein [Methanoregula sp.]
MIPQPRFLPVSPEEGKRLGIDQFDIILITGDAYVDHPSFGTALIGRVLWDAGFSVGIITQPDWKSAMDFTRLGAPRLFFGISSGNVDSMVNHFTPNLKRRSNDVYSSGGIPKRPDRAVIVYANKVRQLFPGTPVILGGIEASLRRFAHYDYWQDRVRQGILADAPADLLAFGMAEWQMAETARRLNAGEPVSSLRDIPGTAYTMEIGEWRSARPEGIVEIPSFTEVSSDKAAYARAFALHYHEQDPVRGKVVAQPHPKTIVLQNPPARPIPTPDLDHIYELPFSREAHPSYREPVPALEPVRFSVTSHRGCFGGCWFCALTHHQGRIIQARSTASLVREVTCLTKMSGFRGIVQDVGGPTANMFGLYCDLWEKHGACRDKQCSPACRTLHTSHQAQCELLTSLRQIPGVRKVFIGSGIRYDLVMADQSGYLGMICDHHVSGHLKVAPEHVAENVTAIMHKPPQEVFDRFREAFAALQQNKQKKQYILPYFMSGHPGCTIRDMVLLAEYIRDNNLYTEQVQDFTPTPMSVSTCMYYTGLDPFTLEPVHVAKGREKLVQRALLQYREPRNRPLVIEGLEAAGRRDLIGGPRSLVGSGSPAPQRSFQKHKDQKRDR